MPIKSPPSNSHQDTQKKSQRAQYTGPFSLSIKPKVHNEPNLDDKSQSFQIAAKTTTNEVHDVKGDPSNIFKSFSQPTQSKANSDPVVSEGLAPTASGIRNLQSVRNEAISELFLIYSQPDRMTLSIRGVVRKNLVLSYRC